MLFFKEKVDINISERHNRRWHSLNFISRTMQSQKAALACSAYAYL